MLFLRVSFLAFVSQVTSFGLHLEDTRFNSWYLNNFCDTPTNATDDIDLSTEGPTSGGVFALAYNSPYYEPGMNCTVQLVAPRSYKLLLSFSQVNTRNRILDSIVLEVEGVRKVLNKSHIDCPKEDCTKYQFSGKRILLNFSSAPTGTVAPELVGFSSIVTAFVETNATAKCPGQEHFRCQNLRCIWQGLYCNGQNNCGDGSDEPSHCPTAEFWGILVIVFGAVCFCIFVPLFCFLVLWGNRKRLDTTTSQYQPILSSSINDMDADNLPILSESDFLFGPLMPDQFGRLRPHSYSFTYGTTAVQIHSPAVKEDNTISKSVGKGNSPVRC